MLKKGLNIKHSFFHGSIQKQLRLSYTLIVILMVIPIIYSVSVSHMHTTQYDMIITNVSRANRLNQIVKVDISNEVWDIVAGKKTFSDGSQYEILDSITSEISEMMELTQVEKNRNLLEVANRAVNTLIKYVDLLGTQTEQSASVADMEQTLEEVRGVTALIYDILQDFIVAEIETAAQTNESIKKTSATLTTIQIFITMLIIAVSIVALFSVSKAIRSPIHNMEVLSSRITEGDLDARVEVSPVEELTHLSINLNKMAGNIKNLIDANIREQQNLQKAEMKTLQAQISPHFLYNTLDTIIWLAESNQSDEVIEITRALSGFFRISLSKGHEWITVEQELDHVRNYLTIQKIRYRDILDYSLDVDERLHSNKILKLVLQPLVENAIYHGIKNKRGRGKLIVTARLEKNENNIDMMFFSVEDNGIGFTPERLAEVTTELSSGMPPENLNAVYGLYNVNKRLNLYYDESVSLKIESEYGKGTRVSFSITCSPNRS